MALVREYSLMQGRTHSAPAAQRDRCPLVEVDRRKEMESGRLRDAANTFAGPEVCTQHSSVISEGERWKHNPGRREAWSVCTSSLSPCATEVPWH